MLTPIFGANFVRWGTKFRGMFGANIQQVPASPHPHAYLGRARGSCGGSLLLNWTYFNVFAMCSFARQ